jgi:outer membrane protein
MDKKQFFSILVIFLFGAGLMPAGSQAAQDIKIAVINMQQVVRGSQAGKRAMKMLQKKFDSVQKKLKAKQDKLKAFKKDIEQKASLMNEESRIKKQRQLQRQFAEYRQDEEDAKVEMQQEEAKLMEPIVKQLEKIITKMGKDEKYTLILEKNMPGMYYISPAVDITEKVIKKINSGSK